MIEFKVTSRKATMGKMKGKTVYIAVPKRSAEAYARDGAGTYCS